ncbi:hypothetical protein GCM10009555_018600 [Acrocarpospora macrocephala]|uniref:Uncharacterized protein n=1 Tax=Acrocarpospora macrocephala TaxID=150177 RepID=A0A5M3WGU9_9ACTN|nr:hypothetical protein Amac_011150 [Acrocarpospora macrocephala]
MGGWSSRPKGPEVGGPWWKVLMPVIPGQSLPSPMWFMPGLPVWSRWKGASGAKSARTTLPGGQGDGLNHTQHDLGSL